MGLRRYVTDRIEEGVAAVDEHLVDLASGDEPWDGACAAWDGYLNAEGRRTDAVFARATDPTGAEVVLAQRYEVRGLVRKTARRVGNPALVGDTRQ